MMKMISCSRTTHGDNKIKTIINFRLIISIMTPNWLFSLLCYLTQISCLFYNIDVGYFCHKSGTYMCKSATFRTSTVHTIHSRSQFTWVTSVRWSLLFTKVKWIFLIELLLFYFYFPLFYIFFIWLDGLYVVFTITSDIKQNIMVSLE